MGRDFVRLRCTLSLCRIAESIIKTRYPKMPADLPRSASLQRGTSIRTHTHVVRPKGFYKDLARREALVKHKKALTANELRKCVEYMMFEL